MLDLSGIGPGTPLGWLLRLPIRMLPGSMVVRVLQGPLRGARWVVGSGVAGYWLGWYERPKQEVLSQLVRPGDVLWDVGANVGFYSLLGARFTGAGGRVVAFEPVPRNPMYLHRHLALNAELGSRVTVVPLAVAERDRLSNFAADDNPSTGKLAAGGEYLVQARSLDSLLSEGILPQPTVIKMDIEGAEVAALEGARKLLSEGRPILALATHGPELRSQCLALLTQMGYKVEPLSPLGDSPADELLAFPRS